MQFAAKKLGHEGVNKHKKVGYKNCFVELRGLHVCVAVVDERQVQFARCIADDACTLISLDDEVGKVSVRGVDGVYHLFAQAESRLLDVIAIDVANLWDTEIKEPIRQTRHLLLRQQ